MPNDNNKNIEAIGKILTLTRDGTIVWEVAQKNQIDKTEEDEITIPFKTTYLEKNLRIYQKRYKKKIRKASASLLYSMSVFERDDDKNYEYRTYSKTMLEITDNFGNALWTFPDEDILDDLLKAVKYKSSGAQDFIDQLLEDTKE